MSQQATQIDSRSAAGRFRMQQTPTPRLVGLEEELLLVDAESFTPVPASSAVLDAHARRGQGASSMLLEAEAKLEQIEVVSPPLLTSDELLDAVVSGRRAADDAARMIGARAAALATAPVRCDSHLSSGPRYDQMSERFGLTMAEQLTCGFHVHVSITSVAEGVAVLDRIRIWLPLILALSTNSPFWHGTDTGYASYRYQAWGRWPTAGPYECFGSASAYVDAVDRLLRTSVSLDAGMIYFDARLSAHVPTVEVRIADVCLAPEDAVTVAVIARALVNAAAAEWRAGIAPPDAPASVLRLASWRASRSGVGDDLIDPLSGLPRPAAVCVEALLAHLDGHFASSTEAAHARRGVSEILRRGTGATRQRAIVSEGGIGFDVVADAVDRTRRAPGGTRSALEHGRSL